MESNNWKAVAASVGTAVIVGVGGVFFVGHERSIRLEEKITALQGRTKAVQTSVGESEARSRESLRRVYDFGREDKKELSHELEWLIMLNRDDQRLPTLNLTEVRQDMSELRDLLHTTIKLIGRGSVGQLSDSRLKTKVTPLNDVLEKLSQLQGVSYTWNEKGTALGFTAEQRDIGLLAQDVEAIFPELVSSWEGTGYKTIDYAKLSGVLISAVNELRAEKDMQIVKLETRITALEQKVGGQGQATPTPSSLLPFSSLIVGGLVVGMVSRRRERFSGLDN